MNVDTWVAIGGLFVTTVIALGGVLAYLLRQIDQMERRVLSHIAEVYGRQVDVVRIQEQVIEANRKLDRLLERP